MTDNKSYTHKMVDNTNSKNLLIYFAISNIALIIMMMGSSMNINAIRTNDGKMPVYKYGVETEIHKLFYNKSEVNNFYLTDIIKVDSINKIISIGDIFLTLGFSLLIINLIIYGYNFIQLRAKNRSRFANI